MKKLNGYFALVLDDQSSQILQKHAEHSQVFCHHVTLAYKPTILVALKYFFLLGRRLSVEAWGIVCDGNGQAVLVRGVASENKHPHVTISCADGIEPVYSNALCDVATPYEFSIQLHGTVEWVGK